MMRFSFNLRRAGLLLGLALAGVLAAPSAQAYPPAPHHLFYGMVRDEYGTPVNLTTAEIILETANGTKITTVITPGYRPGINYNLPVPMDAGLTSDLYRPTALLPLVPFKIRVKIGLVTYLPIEMVVNYANLGQPGGSTRLDLTLGADTDGDGLPDAWERLLLGMLGGDKTLADIKADGDDDGDGLSNLQEYQAGTYAFDQQSGFALKIARVQNQHPVLEFLGVRGRSYTVVGSADLKEWSPMEFQVLNGTTATGPVLSGYFSRDIRNVQVEVLSTNAVPRFFKLLVQ